MRNGIVMVCVVFYLGLISGCATQPWEDGGESKLQESVENEQFAEASISSDMPRETGALAAVADCEYVPVDPAFLPDYREYELDDEGELEPVRRLWREVANLEDKHNLLPNIATNVVVRDVKTDADVGIFSGNVTHKRVVMDFMKYRSEPVFADEQYSHHARIGVGMRLKLDIQTEETGLDFGSLVSIAASVSQGDTQGRVTTDIIGISSKEVTISAPLSAKLSDTAVEQVLQTFASIRAKMHDDDTEITPQHVARLSCGRS